MRLKKRSFLEWIKYIQLENYKRQCEDDLWKFSERSRLLKEGIDIYNTTAVYRG